jgi:hypothetical protein
MNIGSGVNSAAEWVSTRPIIGPCISNPVFMALFLTALVVVILMAMYHNTIKKAGWHKGLRAFVFILIAMATMLFLHYYAVRRVARASVAEGGRRDIFSSIEEARRMGGGHAVSPGGYRVSFDEAEEGAGDTSPREAAHESSRAGRPDNVADAQWQQAQYSPAAQYPADARRAHLHDPITVPTFMARPGRSGGHSHSYSRHRRDESR